MSIEKDIRVLLIDDDEDDYFMLKAHLNEVKNKSFKLEWASSYEAGKTLLLKKQHDICILDYRLGVKTGLDLLKEAMQSAIKTPMILLTGYGELDVDFEAMRMGASDYLVKDEINPLLLERSIRYSIHRAQALQAILDREAQILVQDRLASVGLLASSLAHEIGTPLGVIRGRAEYLELQVGNDEKIKKNVEVIINQIDRVSKLIRSLLNLARGDQMKTAEKVNLRDIVLEVVELMAHELKKHSIEFQDELPTNVAVQVNADAGSLHQVVLNVIVNSVHAIESAMKSGRNSGHYIKVSVVEVDGNWELIFEDSGCGISAGNLKNIFKPFFTTKEIGVGTGLGLATSYRIVESWGGKMRASSTEGSGAEFRMILPRSKPMADSRAQ